MVFVRPHQCGPRSWMNQNSSLRPGFELEVEGANLGSSYGERLGVLFTKNPINALKKNGFRSSTGKPVEIGVLQHWCLESKFSKSKSHCSTDYSYKLRGTFPQAGTEKASRPIHWVENIWQKLTWPSPGEGIAQIVMQSSLDPESQFQGELPSFSSTSPCLSSNL